MQSQDCPARELHLSSWDGQVWKNRGVAWKLQWFISSCLEMMNYLAAAMICEDWPENVANIFKYYPWSVVLCAHCRCLGSPKAFSSPALIARWAIRAQYWKLYFSFHCSAADQTKAPCQIIGYLYVWWNSICINLAKMLWGPERLLNASFSSLDYSLNKVCRLFGLYEI